MSDFDDVKAKKEFDHAMLKTLLVEFLSGGNMPFSIVHNSRLRALFRFICPSVVIPTHQELYKHHASNNEIFKCWDKVPDSATLNEERLQMVRKWAWADPKEGDVCVSRDEQSLGKVLKDDPDTPTSSLIPNKNIKEEPVDMDDEDVKPTPEELQMILAKPGSSSSCGGKIRPTSNKPTPALLKINEVPGLAKYPCVVCNQHREPIRVRDVKNTNALIMIHLCVKSGQYSMEMGKQLARMKGFRCCVEHLGDIYNHAKQFLNVSNPQVDIDERNKKIMEAYYSVKELRESRYVQPYIINGCNNPQYMFFLAVRQFFVTYGRQNYKAYPGQAGYLVEEKKEKK